LSSQNSALSDSDAHLPTWSINNSNTLTASNIVVADLQQHMDGVAAAVTPTLTALIRGTLSLE